MVVPASLWPVTLPGQHALVLVPPAGSWKSRGSKAMFGESPPSWRCSGAVAATAANSQSGLPAPVKIPEPPDAPNDTTDLGPTARFALRQFATSTSDYVAQAEALKVTALAHIPPLGPDGSRASWVGSLGL
jgi:hypothetical protein